MSVLSVLRTCMRYVRGTFGTIVMFATAPIYLVIHTGWRVVSILMPRRWFYKGDDFLWGSYQKLIVFFFEHTTGVEINISGEIPQNKENVILICNHQCSMDWIVTDFLAARQGMIGNMRYVFKNSIKYWPLYGYVFGVHGGVFVKRDGSYNERNMTRVLTYLMKHRVEMYFVIFPEGTRFSVKRKELLAKSQQYAIENDLKPLNQVLTPRIKAFYCAISTMKTYLNAVYDATIIYESADNLKRVGERTPAPNMWAFLNSDSPKVHIHFERIPIENIPTSSQRATMRWLHHRYAMKDQAICRHFGIEYPTEQSPSIAGVVTQMDINENQLADEKPSHLPISQTLPSAAFYTGTLMGVTCHPVGRMGYGCVLLGGSLLGMGYAKLFL
uniref:1-acyl-sn-glycerol-3-phosphate acyltransferase epsilon-like n=1 Tax=Phallusia mammillata TaxID=59560 RepID=A0A6F9D6K3_9ASCI|nr:1-acyl-sn-glycerol-3-phosphate acyltransferase epsilon-like [Phallusia mammillata]